MWCFESVSWDFSSCHFVREFPQGKKRQSFRRFRDAHPFQSYPLSASHVLAPQQRTVKKSAMHPTIAPKTAQESVVQSIMIPETVQKNQREIPQERQVNLERPIEILFCPHCQGGFEVDLILCGVFRHAVLKGNGVLVSPHASEKELDELLQQDLIYGCGKPFFYNAKSPPVVCDYI
jgi:hypothetical protein